jgi:transposase-like protein
MPECKVCNRWPDEIPGKAVSDVPELASHLEKLTTDFKLWITRFRCKECGQIWEERYESKGHANVPSIKKVKS